MKQTLLAFLRRPTTLVGMITALVFQVVFSLVWMTGYDGVTDRTEQLRIAIVNEDEELGAIVAENAVAQLPFTMTQLDSLDIAKQQLKDREIQMAIYLPSGWSQGIANIEEPMLIQYWVNESNPTMIKSVMSSVAAQFTANVNKLATANGVQSVIRSVNAEIPVEQAASIGVGLSERVKSDLHSMNPVQGMSNQMVPLMMVLASFVGAMTMGMNFEQSSAALRALEGKWRVFIIQALISLLTAVVISLVGTTLLTLLGGQMEQGFMAIWSFQTICVITFMCVSQMFLYLFGMAGMLFNILTLSLQLVSSGAMVPRELLSDFYVSLGNILPATYAVDGSMNLLFGGPGVGSEVMALVCIAMTACIVSTAAVALKKSRLVASHVTAMKQA